MNWGNDAIGQAGLEPPGSDSELVLTTEHDYEPNWLVDSVDDAVETFRNNGGTVVATAVDTPVGRVATVLDPFDLPWLTAIIDDYSRAIAGYAASLRAPSALHTALALRQAIWQKTAARWHICGVPDVFYSDHGSDVTSQHLEQVAADMNMVLVFSTVGQPRGRGRIERFFLSVNQLFLCQQPGYTTPGSPKATAKLTLPELDRRLRDFIVEDYHARVHSETGVAPQERWEMSGFLPRPPDSLEQLDLLLLTVAKSRKVHQDGIRFQGFRYLDLALAA